MTTGYQSPSSRPSPDDWGHALQVAINDLVVCNTNKNHIYSKRLSSCCWCDRYNALGVDIFPDVKNTIAPQNISITPPPNPAISRLQSQNKALTQQIQKLPSDNQSLSRKISHI